MQALARKPLTLMLVKQGKGIPLQSKTYTPPPALTPPSREALRARESLPDQGCVLLGMKKRGFGEGKYNGFGGKVELKETVKQAALRELQEEAGIRALNAKRAGTICFEFVNDPTLLEVHVYTATVFDGEIRESEEMRPTWFPYRSIPFDDMWKDDLLWMQHAIAEQPFAAYCLFEGQTKIVTSAVELLDTSHTPPSLPTAPCSTLNQLECGGDSDEQLMANQAMLCLDRLFSQHSPTSHGLKSLQYSAVPLRFPS